jgi:uncharacterized membrane protein YeiH
MNWLSGLVWFGTAVFAASGVLACRAKRLDLFGVSVIASVTALGGGTLRDVLLGSYPVSWVRDPTVLSVTILVGVITFFLSRLTTKAATNSLWLYGSDAVGLAVFSIVGTAKTLEMGQSTLIALVMGVTTGAAGGLIRDLLVGEVPLILKREIYATAALIGSIAWMALRVPLGDEAASAVSIVITLVIRLVALRWNLKLPGLDRE